MSKSVDYRETLITYLRSGTTADAAKTLGISTITLASRIKALRTAGVEVPKKMHRRSLSKLEIAHLNSIVRKHKKELEEQA